MIRRLVLVFSLALAGVGVYLISRVHQTENVCSHNASPLTGAGVGANCMNMVSFYYIGFAIVLAGFIIFVLALISRSKAEREGRRNSRRRAAERIKERENNPIRNM